MDAKPYLTVADLVEIGPLCRASWFNAIRDGQIVARKIGRRTVVLREDYDRFLRDLPKVTRSATRRAA